MPPFSLSLSLSFCGAELTLSMWLEKNVSSIHAHNHTEFTQNPSGEEEGDTAGMI